MKEPYPFTIVRHGNFNYVCMDMPDRIKCGKCLRGNVINKKGFKCRVCQARVV